jgi:predicted helicase
LVKNPGTSEHGQVFFHDIGDYLSQAEKLQKIVDFGSVLGISAVDGWQTITPDEHGDWLKQRDGAFDEFINMGNKKDRESKKLFETYSMGIKTNRDVWVYNASKAAVTSNLQAMVAFYNSEVRRYAEACESQKKSGITSVEDFIDSDVKKISWSRALRSGIARGQSKTFRADALTIGFYRPFFKQHLYFDKELINDIALNPRFFPTSDSSNRVIMLKMRWPGEGQLALMVDCIPELQTDGGTQCFPLHLYDEPETGNSDDLFASAPKERTRRDAITKEGLAHFQAAYPSEKFTREDIFYYVYGLLHSTDYRERYADNLSKELPRIPCVKAASDFWAFSKAGRTLAELHLNYETVEPYPCEVVAKGTLTAQSYRVEKMKYKSKDDKTVLVYNDFITLKGIPLEAYEYVVNGKSALDWVVERQCVKTDKDSGIVNDANDWATETMGNPKYPLELFQRVITVSLETMKIVKSLPALAI